MNRDVGVPFEQVRRACFAIMAEGQRPSRPAVQELLARSDYIGRKGSNEAVQRHITDFWASMGKTMQIPDRGVEGVPDEFVAIFDAALREMVVVARQSAQKSLADKELALDQRATAMDKAIQEAHDVAQAADQLRLRAEGELLSAHTLVNELKANLASTERKLADEAGKVAAHQKTIDEKDAEIRRQYVSIETAHRAAADANEQHRAELNRLMQQVDNERQANRKEIVRVSLQLDRARELHAAGQTESAALREEVGRLRAELHSASVARQVLEAAERDANVALAEKTQRLQAAEQELAVMRTRFETTEQQRIDADHRIQLQAEEVGELRKSLEHATEALRTERAKSKAKGSAKSQSKSAGQVPSGDDVKSE